MPTSNLLGDEPELPAFEPFEDRAGPRSLQPAVGGALSVESVDMCQQTNKANHYTTAYDTSNLVVRRGQEFIVRVTFNREVVPGDDFQLEFLIGELPSHWLPRPRLFYFLFL